MKKKPTVHVCFEKKEKTYPQVLVAQVLVVFLGPVGGPGQKMTKVSVEEEEEEEEEEEFERIDNAHFSLSSQSRHLRVSPSLSESLPLSPSLSLSLPPSLSSSVQSLVLFPLAVESKILF